MTGPPAATAAVRLAVRRCLSDVTEPVVAAVSGGTDSLALASALAFERPGSAAVVVDHQLQEGSAAVAARAAEQCTGLGLRVRVITADAPASAGGPEAQARQIRYDVLDAVEGVKLLGHTKDDQAESVLLGLVRGSGARALSGMPAIRDGYRRPFLELSRQTTRAACEEAGLQPWEDPHNEDPSFLRVRVRQLLDGLDLTEGLARSARLLREDADALDALASAECEVGPLALLPPALRARSMKLWAEQECGQAVTSAHVDALRALVEAWHGQGAVALPGGGRATRAEGRLVFVPPA
ncbi:MAG: tRNA(Ile)-lysidine synthetase [Frankiales bacterium]|nr:tRNA(Ile)-lysidine synthetase [Frankiales bacterium]